MDLFKTWFHWCIIIDHCSNNCMLAGEHHPHEIRLSTNCFCLIMFNIFSSVFMPNYQILPSILLLSFRHYPFVLSFQISCFLEIICMTMPPTSLNHANQPCLRYMKIYLVFYPWSTCTWKSTLFFILDQHALSFNFIT